MVQVNCVFCNASISDAVADIGTHVTSAHAFDNDAHWPNNAKDANNQRTVRDAAGADHVLGTAADVVAYIATHSAPARAAPVVNNPVGNVNQGLLARCGITTANINTLRVKAMGTGGVCSPEQVEKLWEALDAASGLTVSRGDFFLAMCWEFVHHDATDEDAAYGDVWVAPDASSTGQGKWMKATTIMTAWRDKLKETTGSESRVTWRQLARLWAPEIYNLVQTHPDFQHLTGTGTPMSQKFDIDPCIYYAVLSFFPAMKPYPSWTEAERLAHEAHTNSVVKQAKNAGQATVNFIGLDPTGTRRTVMKAGLGLRPPVPLSSQQAMYPPPPAGIPPQFAHMLMNMGNQGSP